VISIITGGEHFLSEDLTELATDYGFTHSQLEKIHTARDEIE
jgi:hypothetical protein